MNLHWRRHYNSSLTRSLHKGFLKNLLHITIPCIPGDKVNLVIALPYFPVDPGKEYLLSRNFETELNNVTQYWPYINYADVGPMHLIDCDVLESSSDIADWILNFESNYPIALLHNEISLTENRVHSIRQEGDVLAHLLHHGISTIEPFYAPRSTLFLENDQINEYLKVFYHQLAGSVSHKNLSPCENRYGVWFLPWANAEFHRMILRGNMFT